MVDYSDINEEIINLWKEFPNERGNTIPLLFPPSEREGILFVGFNPSFPTAIENKLGHLYDIDTLDRINVDTVIKEEMKAQATLAYFSPLRDIASKLNLPWSHLDIFMFRETSQNRAQERVFTDTRQFTSFGEKQFALFRKALYKTHPKVIVVINAAASHILKVYLGLNYNDADGCYYSSDEKINAPVFLGSMLSGQRALDIYNRERLIWHMKRVTRTRE
jgi:hypothetical protein